MAITPFMSLTLPTVEVTPGPTYATQNNTAFTAVDSHNHTSGQGVRIPTLGININADLSFANFNSLQLRSSRYTNQISPLALPSDITCVFFSGGELYANDASGNHVKITDGGAVNVSGAGSIGGMGATTASVTYASGSQEFTFLSNTNVRAFIDCASISIHTTVASSAAVTLASGTLSGGAYTLTLPTAIATTNNGILMSSNAGVLSYLVLGSANTVLRVNSAGTAVEYSTLIGTNITSNIDLPGNAVQENAKNLVVSNTNATNSISIVRGSYFSTGPVILSGEGFSIARNGIGDVTVTFTTAFGDTPVAVATVGPSISDFIVNVRSIGTTAVRLTVTTNSGSGSEANVQFIVMGQRA